MDVLEGEVMPKITICMQVYNTAAFLAQCVESVLKQTYPDFEFIIVDNGSTDGCKDMLRKYAKQDSRIRLIRHEQNSREPFCVYAAHDLGVGEYYATIDSDDWWELDHLEKLLDFAEKNRLDIACTGTVMHVMATSERGLRKLDQPLIISRNGFAQKLPWYHAFFRPVWGKLIRMSCLRAVPLGAVPDLPYGTDTLWCFQILRHTDRIGVDASILHHYRIHKHSATYQYDPKRFEADVYLYNDAIDFLSAFGPINAQNRNFLQIVYSNAVRDTAAVIHNSTLSPVEKLREYHAIAAHALTQAAYQECANESVNNGKTYLLCRAIEAGAALDGQDDSDFRATMQMLLPCCGRALTAANAQMFSKNPALLQTLLQDDIDAVLDYLLERMKEKAGVKKYAVPQLIQALAIDKPLLCQINDAAFLRKYTGIYRMVWRGDLLAALDEMTGLLLGNKVSSGRETFLNLFVSLAAAENQASAFLYGKIQLAQLYLRQNRLAECCTMVEELAAMGVENEDMNALKREIKGM